MRGGRLKLAVFAGTPRDTQMGIDVLKESGFESLAYPFSKNPEEQTKLQYYSKEELEAISDLSRHSGIILDPVYTGKAYYGLIHELEKGTFDHAKNILFMHTGGIYGLFSKSKEIISA